MFQGGPGWRSTGRSPVGYAYTGRGHASMPVDTTDFQALDYLLDELDVRAHMHTAEDAEDTYWVSKRKRLRHPFRVACTVRFMPLGSGTVAAIPGRTRNLSRGGVAVLARRMFLQGDPIELEVCLPDRPRMFMGGLVSFCRYAGRGYYELGVKLKAAASEPIFSSHPTLAVRALDWLNPEKQDR